VEWRRNVVCAREVSVSQHSRDRRIFESPHIKHLTKDRDFVEVLEISEKMV
jgi:hypothetical protein